MSDTRSGTTRRTGSVFREPLPEYNPNLPDQALRERMQERLFGEEETDTRQEERRNRRDEEEDAAAEQEAENRRGDLNELQASRKDKVYIDGRLVETYVITDEDGVQHEVVKLGGYDTRGQVDNDYGVTLSRADRAEFETRRAARSATYSILGLGDLDEDAKFIMSHGGVLTEDGNEQDVTGTDDPRQQAIRQSRKNANATNMMSLAGGVTWFRNLANADPQAYNEMIDSLVAADYLTEEEARRGAYTINAGRAFAYAAADASENAAGGSKDDLRTFLQRMAADVEANGGGQGDYTPATRSYIDPEALNSTARQAAEDLLGRTLSEEELARFQGKFRGLENSYYDQVDAAAQNGGARVADPNAGGQAEAFVRSPEFDADRTKQLTGGYMDALNQLLGG